MKIFLQHIILLILCVFSSVTLTSQQTPNFELIGNSVGLSNSYINCIYKDHFGFIWIGTDNGLNRFDGYKCKVFKHEKGNVHSLSNNKINSIVEDDLGNLWIGTLDGLTIYNRKKESFTTYKAIPENKSSLPGNLIKSITKDSNGNLWIGSGYEGVCIISKENIEKNDISFYRFDRKKGINKTFINDEMSFIYNDKNGDIWIGSKNGGLEKYSFNNINSQSNSIITALVERDFKFEYYYKHNNTEENSIASNIILSMHQDTDNNYWIAHESAGIDRLSYKNNQPVFVNYANSKENPNLLTHNNINTIVEDKERNLWFGTYEGLSLLKKSEINNISKQEEIGNYPPDFNQFQHNTNQKNSLGNNIVLSSYSDDDGILWIGTSDGIYKFDPNKIKFNSFTLDIEEENNFSSNFISAIFQNEKNLYIGSEGGGLNIIDQSSGDISYIQKNDGTNSITNNFVRSFAEDDFGGLWIGTKHGLNRYDKSSGKVIQFKHDPLKKNCILEATINDLLIDRNGYLWIATWKGLNRSLMPIEQLISEYESRNNSNNYPEGFFAKITNEDNSPLRFNDRRVKTICEDKNGIIWAGTPIGLEKISISGIDDHNNLVGEIKNYKYDPSDDSTLNDSNITAICEDFFGQLWVGTEVGLNKMNPDGTFIRFDEKDGLPSNQVRTIINDFENNLWISTTSNLIKFNPNLKEFTKFTIEDGLPSNSFLVNSTFSDKEGMLYFGTYSGYISFNPRHIRKNAVKPPLVFTDFNVQYKDIPVGKKMDERIILNQSINYTKNIVLPFNKNVFMFEFAALAYRNPQKHEYRYKLDGFNDNWVNTSATNRMVTYTNINPGDYTLHIQGTNEDGIWNTKGLELGIKILPPFWRTWYAYLSYLILIVLTTIGALRIITVRLRMKNEIVRERVEKEQNQELNNMKLRFFTNVSHEFSTSLSLIIGPLENIIDSGFGGRVVKGQLLMIQRNSNRLMRLIKQILEFRKAEVGQMKLRAPKGDIVKFVNEVVALFYSMATQNNIKLAVVSLNEECELWFDREKMDKILFNLISNAFKHTDDNGNITIYIDEIIIDGKNKVEIKVTDNGSGISKENVDRVFERFYQIEQDSIGMGIGLSMSKKLVELHHGTIKVESAEGKGTSFILHFNCGKSHLQEDEIYDSAVSYNHIEKLPIVEQDNSEKVSSSNASKYAKKILVVEDTPDFREFIVQKLSVVFKVYEAKDGEEGLEMVENIQPDLIISDVLMPKMDGFEFCKKIKSDIRSSHIPVILLTALANVENNTEGLTLGADDYIAKPFNFDLLLVRIESLLKNRDRIKEHFKSANLINLDKIQLNPMDNEFLKKLNAVVNDNLTDTSLDVACLSDNMAMSRSNLHLKLKALTGQSTTEFIRSLRLNKATEFLVKTDKTTSEIVYEAGFKTPSYFYRSFKKYFGETPSEYRTKNSSWTK